MAKISYIDAAYTNDTSWPKVRIYFASLTLLAQKCLSPTMQVKNGVRIGEGDGTVSLLSLGAMCVEGWTRKRWNPAGIKVTTVEVSSAMLF